MRIAIFHNFMDNIGGAEIVSLILARELGADIYSTNFDYDKIKKMGFEGIKINSIGRVPLNAPLRQQIASFRFRNLNLGKKYDFYIIAGDWAISAAVNHKPNLWYVHSPIREIWDLYEHTRSALVPWYGRWTFDAWVKFNRHLCKKYFEHVGKIACNSKNTQSRVLKYLGRDSEVIYPPIETGRFYRKESGDYWLSVNRLLAHKRVEIQVKAFSKMPDKKLIIVGSYEPARHFKKYVSYIRSMVPANVEIKSWVSVDELRELYAGCRGFIATDTNEDFGMTVVEAMASGKPVVAGCDGGYKETVVDKVTGVLIKDINADKLADAINSIDGMCDEYSESCIARAKKFDVSKFISRIKMKIEDGG